MGNPFVYVQLHTNDLSAARDFYGELFDWKFDQFDTPSGPYVEIRVGDGTAGGMTTQRSEQGSHWYPYILVEDIETRTDQASSLGATVLQGPTQLPDKSWFSVLVDPNGAPFALHQRADT